MKHTSAPFFALALALLIFAGGQAQAGFAAWTYNWSPSSLAIAADSPGTGGINFTNGQSTQATGNSDIVATNLRTFSSAPDSSPDHFTNKSYSLNFSLRDNASASATTLNFTGTFSGALSVTNANIANAFTGLVKQVVTLGQNVYTVTIGPYAPPGPPSATNAGSISAHVSVAPVGGGTGGGTTGGGTTGGGTTGGGTTGGGTTGGGTAGGKPPPVGAPEPSTLVLSCLGLGLLGFGSWRKWARRQ